jgi:dGTPase
VFREKQQKKETEWLSEYAIKSIQAVRERPETKHPYRTEFQRDRDRILYSRYFRLLMHKTQVLPSPELTHIRTRLTHTLEVAQVARTIARALRLNEDLAEAIAMGHDLGHPPFGHAGEEALKESMKDYNGFEHNEQSLRIVETLEDLNLTSHVREGILRHTLPDEKFYSLNNVKRNLSSLKKRFGYPNIRPTFFEAQIVDVADEIAYLTHDIEDLRLLGIIQLSEIPSGWKKLFGPKRRDAIDGLVTNVIKHAEQVLKKGLIDEVKTPIIYDEQMHGKVIELKSTLGGIFNRPPLGPKFKEAKHYIRLLFEYWSSNPCKEIQEGIAMTRGEPAAIGVADFVVEKTDQDIIREYEKTFSPRTPMPN